MKLYFTTLIKTILISTYSNLEMVTNFDVVLREEQPKQKIYFN